MKKIVTTLLLAFAVCFAATAEDVTLTKCRGVVARKGWGDKRCPTVSAATQFTADETATCTGGQLTMLRCYIANTDYLGSLELWVKSKYDDAEKLASVTLAEPSTGWNEVTLDEPIQVQPSMPIALGLTYTASGGTAKPLAFADAVTPGGIYLNLGNGFIDGTAYPAVYANLCIEATVTGLDLNYDVDITSLTLDDHYYATSGTATATIGYHNRGRALSSLTLSLTTNNQTQTRTINENLINDQTRTTSITFAVPDLANGAYDLSARVTAIDGQPYDGTPATTTYGAVNYTLPRNVVIEEVTGTWCGWCIRGFVGMEQMHNKYPDSFIGIAVHYNDAMQASDYWTPIGYTQAPCCDVDRHPSMAMMGVTPYNFQVAYDRERTRMTFADFNFTALIDQTSGDIVAHTDATFNFDASVADLRMVYALIEDGVTGYPQKNYYAGGGNGTMGGYENRPERIDDMVYNEVARAIFPSYAGEAGSLATSIVEGQTYTHHLRVAIPRNVKNRANLSLVAMMLDGCTGQIIQAHRVKLEEGDGIANVATNNNGATYDLQGRRITSPQHGLYIQDGGKFLIRQ